jgi:hypothetical protein
MMSRGAPPAETTQYEGDQKCSPFHKSYANLLTQICSLFTTSLKSVSPSTKPRLSGWPELSSPQSLLSAELAVGQLRVASPTLSMLIAALVSRLNGAVDLRIPVDPTGSADLAVSEDSCLVVDLRVPVDAGAVED